MAQIDLGPVIGPQGPKGDPGEIGPQGPQGPQGPAGKFDMDAGLTFSKASARANINSGESLKTILGKIKKYFTDLKPHAFKAPANNFTTTDATTAAAAPTVKQLKEDYDALNSALVDNLNKNEVALTVSSYYPTSYLYRSGQVVYLRCAGLVKQAVSEGTEYTVTTNAPSAYRPSVELILFAVAVIDGTIIRVRISPDGQITFTPSRDLIVGLGLNLHLMYMTGKSNF